MKIPEKFKDRVGAFYQDEDGLWIILRSGWVAQFDDAKTIHAETVKEALYELKMAKPVVKMPDVIVTDPNGMQFRITFKQAWEQIEDPDLMEKLGRGLPVFSNFRIYEKETGEYIRKHCM